MAFPSYLGGALVILLQALALVDGLLRQTQICGALGHEVSIHVYQRRIWIDFQPARQPPIAQQSVIGYSQMMLRIKEPAQMLKLCMVKIGRAQMINQFLRMAKAVGIQRLNGRKIHPAF